MKNVIPGHKHQGMYVIKISKIRGCERFLLELQAKTKGAPKSVKTMIVDWIFGSWPFFPHLEAEKGTPRDVRSWDVPFSIFPRWN